MFFIPLYPKFPLLGIPETYVHIRLEDIFVAIIVGFFLIKLLIERRTSFFRERLVWLTMLFFVVGLISTLSAILITKNIVPHLALLHFLRRFEYLSLLFVAYFSFKEIKQLKTYGWITLLACFGVIIYGLGQKFFGWPVVSTMNQEFSRGLILKLTWWARINSTFAGHYDLAAFMVMIFPLTVVAVMMAKKWWVKALAIILGIAAYYVLILTASRVSFGAYLIGATFVFLAANKKWWLIPFLVLSILGMIFSDDLGQRYAATFKIDLSFLSGKVIFGSKEIASGPTLTPTVTPIPLYTGPTKPLKPGEPTPTPTPTPTPEPVVVGPSEPIESTVLATGRSTDIRLKVEWPRAIRAFAKNPILGTGYSSITLATDNDFLRMLGEIGILGSLAFLAIILEIGRRFFQYLKSRQSSREGKLIIIGITAAAIGYFLNATFIDVLEASKVAFFFWILMGIALRVIDLSNEK